MSGLAQVPTLEEIAARPDRVRALPGHALVDLALRCATVQSALAVALAAAVAEPVAAKATDQLLRAKEAARLLNRTTDWLYRHADELPFTVRQAGQHPRFSSRGLQRYIEDQVAQAAASKGA